ncbi:hypothetical protein [Geobacter sp. SVR]|uniref:hypothetical protein n=1 Tax=Geobacter sp. SVR TaxID=2495594 RepID=UPI00143EF90C|nr:hypothetical protein [Geobacter sp. SVR]BCS55576.1 hypothetical protein GSVR_38840 [Geobacter sp. SVR]GCF83579.1 hypothetical protein GSbR_01790 [Geobacter sp. SVR]
MPQPDDLKRNHCYQIFSQSTGVEIGTAVKVHEEQGRTTERAGRISLRFFKLTPRSKPEEVTQIRFICEPDEAFGLALMIDQVAGSSVPCKEKLSPHKFSTGAQGEETVTTLSVEKWERGGKSGYALTVGRGKDFISVPTPLTKFLFAAEFLRFLATAQCWLERPEKKY